MKNNKFTPQIDNFSSTIFTQQDKSSVTQNTLFKTFFLAYLVHSSSSSNSFSFFTLFFASKKIEHILETYLKR